MIFTVIGKPQGKGRPRFTRAGHTYTPSTTALYENDVRTAFFKAKGVIMEGEIRAVITAFYPIPKATSRKVKQDMLDNLIKPTKKPDCDNVAKIILDALNKIAYNDDSQVVELVVNKRYGEVAKVVVELEEATQETNEETRKATLKTMYEKLSDYCFNRPCLLCKLFNYEGINCPWQDEEPFDENNYNEHEITKAYEIVWGR